MTYKEARAMLDTAKRDRIKLERNTYLERIYSDRIGVRFHATHVVVFTPTYFELDSGDWHTVSTLERMRTYSPCHIGTAWRPTKAAPGWRVFPNAWLPCYCIQEQGSSGLAIRSDSGHVGNWSKMSKPGYVLRFTDEWTGEPYDHEHGSKPIYTWEVCPTCQGTAKRFGADMGSGGFAYFDGIRLDPKGERMMAFQPNAPKRFEVVTTERGGWNY